MIRATTLFKVFSRSFFLQASWSFEKMQGLGFASALEPAINDLYGDDEEKRKEALRRHLTFYNAHPYLASPVLGATVKLEEKVKEGACNPDDAVSFRRKVMGAYGAIGDSFYWNSLRPMAAALGILVTIFWGVWGPVVFFVVYNVFHIWMRWWGLKKGYELGTGVVSHIKSLGLPLWSIRTRYLSCALLGVIAAAASWRILPALVESGYFAMEKSLAVPLTVLAAIGASMFVGLLMKRGFGVSWIIYIVIPFSIICGIIAF